MKRKRKAPTPYTRGLRRKIRKQAREIATLNNLKWVRQDIEKLLEVVDAFRRLSKWLELSPEFRDAIEADADALRETRDDSTLQK